RLKEQFKEGIKTQLYFKKLFGRARESAPSMIVLDDIDEITSQRSLSDLKIRKAVYQLLRELDNIKPGDRLLVTATSDYPHLIEPLLFKSRRFDKLIFVPLPNIDAREELFELYLKDLPVEEDINTKSLARISKGYNGSDIERTIEHAWDLAEDERSNITVHHIEQALKDIRPSSTEDVLEPIKKFFMQYKSGTLGSSTTPSAPDKASDRRGRGGRGRPRPGSRARKHKPEVEYTIEDTDDVVEFEFEPDSDEAVNVDWSDDSDEEEFDGEEEEEEREAVTWESDDEEEIEDWD
ncbi:MAG: ATP-binding protein, partial [Thermoplasmata archaeon]|nr:ATP-binding protein [Thermoplasmata archaeon]